ncbi:MAG: glycosyltransferase family 87 protein [Sphingomicrobium sp.]
MELLATGNWLDSARARRVAFVMLLVTVATLAWLAATSHGTLDWRGRPLGTDFSQVYTAGQMVRDGRVTDVWDWSSHFAVQRAVHDLPTVDVYGWHYPPPFLLLATALSFLPYVTALVVWQLATLGPLAVMGQRFLGRRDGWLFIVGAPVTLICLVHGHNGFLTALLLGGGLLLLNRRPLLAGLLFGALVYKPQFAMIIPLLLLFARSWRAIAGAALSSIVLIGITLILWGWPAWQAFFDSLPLTRHIVIEAGDTGWQKIMSTFSALRAWGWAVEPAYAAQAMVSATALAAVCALALRGRPLLRNAATCAGVLIATPYVLDYDFVVLLLGVGFLWKDAQDHGWQRWEKSLLGLVWIAPLFARQLAEATTIPLGLVTAYIVLAISVRRAGLLTASPFRRSRAASAP